MTAIPQSIVTRARRSEIERLRMFRDLAMDDAREARATYASLDGVLSPSARRRVLVQVDRAKWFHAQLRKTQRQFAQLIKEPKQ